MRILLIIISFILSVTPGAWISFPILRRSTPFIVKLALAIALSPFILGLQIWILTAFGLAFDTSAAVSLANILVLAIVWRERHSHDPKIGQEWLVPIICFSALALAIIFMWTLIPNFRVYSWHNMMQAEVVYQLVGLPHPPDEMGLAGLPLQYNWLAHIQVAAIGRLSDASPFAVFPIVNIATLFAMFTLLVSTVNEMRPGNLSCAALVVTAALLSTNLAGVVWSSVIDDGYIGDIRVVTLVQKFFHFDMMTNGQALLAGIIFLGNRLTQSFSRATWSLIWLCTVATSFNYALMFPAALILSACLLIAPLVQEVRARGLLRVDQRTVLAGASLVLAMLIFIVQLKSLSMGGAEERLESASPDSAIAAIKLWIKTYILWLPLLAVAGMRSWRGGEPYRLALFVSATILSGFGVITHLPENSEYKFLVASLFCALPLVVEQALIWLAPLGRAATPFAAAAAAGVFAVTAPYCVRELVPWDHLGHAVEIDDSHFLVTPSAPAVLSWARVVQHLTPADTILAAPAGYAPLSILTQRAELVARDPPGDRRPGYTMQSEAILAKVKAYPRHILKERERLVRAIYNGAEKNANPATGLTALTPEVITNKIVALGRPVALYLPHGNPYLAWLREHEIGRQIHSDTGGAVVLIQPRSP